MILAEYHRPLDEILDNWTEERLMLIFQKRNERVERWNAVAQPHEPQRQPTRQRVSDVELFKAMGIGTGSA